MKATVTVHMGDVFEGGADLTVLPCGAKPTWTASVDRWIDRFGLPTPKQLRPVMSPSDVTPITPFTGSPAVTKFVAYAASVLNDMTSEEAICALGANVGRLTIAHPSIKLVESVLFGTGYGRLGDVPAATALTRGFRDTADPAARLWIYLHGHERHRIVSAAVADAQSRDAAISQKFQDIRIAVIVALAEEYRIFIQYFQGKLVEKFHVSGLTIDVFERDGYKLGLCVINRMGNVPAAVAATRLLDVFDLDLVVNIGLAGGVNSSEQSLGDVIVASRVRYYESGKLKPDKFELAPEVSDLGSTFVHALQTGDWPNWPLGTSIGGSPRKVWFGTVASGEKVVADGTFVKSLLEQDRNTIGIEMESYGISAAIAGRKEKLLLIRGISDFSGMQKHDNARLSAIEGAIRFFQQALRHGLLIRPGERFVTSKSEGIPTLTITAREVKDGVTNSYVQVSRDSVIDLFHRRRSIIQKIKAKRTMGDLRILAVEFGIHFDEITGNTLSEKAAGLFEYVIRNSLLDLDQLEALIEAE